MHLCVACWMAGCFEPGAGIAAPRAPLSVQGPCWRRPFREATQLWHPPLTYISTAATPSVPSSRCI